ncbi:MAG TPA: WhiB family transcriptional regulator [Trebonia sp.]|nr:WhiB family transcriptional regulator [Trebonia sp.]
MTDYATDWRAASACLSADPDLFFPIATGSAAAVQIGKAQRICASCQVRRECFDFAMRSGETHGVWGGTTPEERIRVRRQRARLTRRAWQSSAKLSVNTPATRAS